MKINNLVYDKSTPPSSLLEASADLRRRASFVYCTGLPLYMSVVCADKGTQGLLDHQFMLHLHPPRIWWVPRSTFSFSQYSFLHVLSWHALPMILPSFSYSCCRFPNRNTTAYGMASQMPNLHDFFGPASSVPASQASTGHPTCSVASSSLPTDCRRQPIGSLAPGPVRTRFTGVVVNLFSHEIDIKSPKAAKGCMKILLRDDTSEILVSA